MYEKHWLTSLSELAIILGICYFIYLSHGWALAAGIGFLGILLLGVAGMCRNIINRLSILYDEVNKYRQT